MKVRHFGLPPTTLIGRTQQADGAAGTGTAQQKTPQISKSADVGLEGGALTFPRGAQELTEKAKSERARVLLETLRADGGGAFGGRVKGGVDVGASLRGYMRSLEVAQLATAKGATGAVDAFIENLDVPADIRPLLTLAVDAHETAGPLGTLKQHENDGNTNAMWNRWQAGDHAVHTVTDDTVRKWFQQWGAGADLSGYLGAGDANFKLGAFRFFARAKELGVNVTVNNYAAYLNQLPVSDDSARTLHRFARAFGIDPAAIQLGGRALSTWSAGAGRSAQPRAVPGSPLGKDAQWLNKPNEWNQALARSDASTVKVNDATLRSIVAAGVIPDAHSFVYNAQPAMKTGALLLYARAKELGLNLAFDVNAVTNLCSYTPPSPENAKAILRIARAAHIDAAHMPFQGQTLGEWAGVKQPKAAGGGGGVAGRPLGKNAQWENEPNYNAFYAAAQSNPASVRNVTDATLAKWFGPWAPGGDLTAYYSTGTPETRISFCLWWARGKELNLGPCTLNAAGLQNVASSMPQTAEAANALRRVGRAFGVPVDQLLLGGATAVSTYPKARGSGGADALAMPARAVLGEGRYTATQIDKAVADQDAKLFAVDDGTVKRIVEKHPGLLDLEAVSGDRAWILGVLDVAERGLALESAGAPIITSQQAQEIIRAVPHRLLDDDVVCQRLATLAARAGLAPGGVALANGFMLSAFAGTKPHAEKLERVLAGLDAEIAPRRAGKLDDVGGLAAPGELGNHPGPHNAPWNAKDVAFLTPSDAALRAEFMGWGDFNSWLPHWNNDARLISFVARIVELNEGNPNSTAHTATRNWLATPVPEMFGTADALPRVLRAARAAGVDPAGVTVVHNGQNVPLLEHPALQALMKGSAADVAERETALREDLAALDPGAAKHPAEREGAALRLLGVTDPDHEIVHRLDELLPAALAGLNDGTLARVDLEKVPAKHRAQVLATAFTRDEHPAVIAVLASLFFKVGAGDVEKLLLQKGHLPKIAKEMGDAAADLMARPASEIAFAAIGASKDPPELASLPLRLWLLSEPTPQAIGKRMAADDTDPHELCVALLELAAAKATPPARKTALMNAVQKAVDDELVTRDLVLAELSDEVKAGLDATAVKNAADCVEAFLNATPSQAAAARQALSAALGAASWVDDPNVIAKGALDVALAHDLRFVAPLGAVDEAAGGVAGKPWQTRLASKTAAVTIGGINIPLEGDAAPLALPSSDDGSGKKNLQQLATRWLTKRPVSVVGADGVDVVRALARATGTKVVDVVVKPDTSVHDLLGADGLVSQAMAQGAVAHLRLEGSTWPDGLGAALMAAAPKGRLVATGPALTGFPALPLAPLDEASVAAHLRAVGVNDDAANEKITGAFLAVRTLARDGGIGDVEEASFPLALLDRIAARVSPGGGEITDAMLSQALADVLALRVGADARDAVLAAIEQWVPLTEGEGGVAIDKKVAVVGEARLAIVGTPAELDSLPPLTKAETEELRATSVALELGEPVVADPSIAERVGTLYGALTGRDVHVHLLHAGSKPEDVLSGANKDVVVVLHDFGSAPLETQKALWTAAAEGRVRLVAADAAMSSDGLVVRAGPVTDEDQAERLRLKARELGLPDAVADGLRDLQNDVDGMITRGEIHPLVDMSLERDLLGPLELLAQLGGAMSTVEAFVAATSASWPMSTPEEQQRLEDAARKVASE